MKQQPILFLTHGRHSWPIDGRPLAIGRFPDNDVVVEGDEVSRVHAYLVATPEGAFLVDRSRHGTSVNGVAIRAPMQLEDGDELCIGQDVFLLKRGLGTGNGDSAAMAASRESASRFRRWVRRYGPSEVIGTVVAVGTAVSVKEATGSTVAAAYAGSLAETAAFYGVMVLRESLREAHQAGLRGQQYGIRNVGRVLGDLLLEFGVAEALDTLLLRPLCIGLGIRWLGASLGAVVGKLAADLGFYGPVLAVYEWRLARRAAYRLEPRTHRITAAALQQAE